MSYHGCVFLCRPYTSRFQRLCGVEGYPRKGQHDRSGASVCLPGLRHLLCHKRQGCCYSCPDHAGRTSCPALTQPYAHIALCSYFPRLLLPYRHTVLSLCCAVLMLPCTQPFFAHTAPYSYCPTLTLHNRGEKQKWQANERFFGCSSQSGKSSHLCHQHTHHLCFGRQVLSPEPTCKCPRSLVD